MVALSIPVAVLHIECASDRRNVNMLMFCLSVIIKSWATARQGLCYPAPMGINSWVPSKGPVTMAHLTRTNIPFHYALADAFTICDAYRCSLLGPT
jgi:hypothetical protein